MEDWDALHHPKLNRPFPASLHPLTRNPPLRATVAIWSPLSQKCQKKRYYL
jgi:hypothetical protein